NRCDGGQARARLGLRAPSNSTLILSTETLPSRPSLTWIMSSLIATYFAITESSSRFIRGRTSAPSRLARSCASTTCRRSLAIAAVAGLAARLGKKKSRMRISRPAEDRAEQALARGCHEPELPLLPQETCHRIVVGASGGAGVVQDHRRAGVGRAQHALGFRDHAEDRHRQDFLHVVDRQHLAVGDPAGGITRQQQMLLDRLLVELGAARL